VLASEQFKISLPNAPLELYEQFQKKSYVLFRFLKTYGQTTNVNLIYLFCFHQFTTV